MKIYRCAQIDDGDHFEFFVDCFIDEAEDKRKCPGFLGEKMPPDEDTRCVWKDCGGRCTSYIVHIKSAKQLVYQLGKKIKELESEQED
ncbi:MAG: hypothetical protein Q4D98_03415 [Planctomycetia bacterium]|nr:hypothetical protein [Planctomycetia bacterium]